MLPKLLVEGVRGFGETARVAIWARVLAAILLLSSRRTRGARRAGLAAIRHRGKHVVVDRDQGGGVLGDMAAVGEHDHDRLADRDTSPSASANDQ
jgi:hypothetical protein